MSRLLILLAVVVGVALWLLKGRRRDVSGTGGKPRGAPPQTAEMLACSHCGVHLPKPEAVFDPEGRPYCGAAHRLAGPR